MSGVQTFGVEVLGLDLSENMVEIAMERAMDENLPTVSQAVLRRKRRVSFTPHTPHTPPIIIIIIIITSAVTETIHCHDSSC